MTAVNTVIAVTIFVVFFGHGDGSEVDRQDCEYFHAFCSKVGFSECDRDEFVRKCADYPDLIPDGLKRTSEVEESLPPIRPEKQWIYFPPDDSALENTENTRKEHAIPLMDEKSWKSPFEDMYDGMSHNGRQVRDAEPHYREKDDDDYDRDDMSANVFQHLMNRNNIGYRQDYSERGGDRRFDDFEEEERRRLLAASINLRKQVERRDNLYDSSSSLFGNEDRNNPLDSVQARSENNRYKSVSEQALFQHNQLFDERNEERDNGLQLHGLFDTNVNHIVQHNSKLRKHAERDTSLKDDKNEKEMKEDNVDSNKIKTVDEFKDKVASMHNLQSRDSAKESKSKDSILGEKKKKDLIFVQVDGNDDIHIIAKSEDEDDANQDQGHLILHVKSKVNTTAAREFANKLQNILWGIKSSSHSVFPQLSSSKHIITLHMVTSRAWFKPNENAKDVANQLNTDKALRLKIKKETGVDIVSADSRGAAIYHHPVDANIADWDQFALVTAIVGGCTLGIIVAAVVVCCIKRRRKDSLVNLKKQEAISDYQELCRTQMSINNSDSPRNLKATYDQQRHGLVNGQGKVMRRTWGEEPQAYNMDISTGHVVLAYMEDHLKNENRLNKEWEALCSYKAEPGDTTSGSDLKNAGKNRYQDVLPFDHTRVKLKETSNIVHSDYINANFITDVDPRNPAYIATQGPLDNTIADFWQMVWEQGVVVIVNLTRLSDMGLPQCNRYWPEDGSEVYHIYEVNLISEHIWCDEYLVRSFYLKNIQTSETRTVTQFHFLTWPDLSVPDSPKPLLEFRRKVNKCYRGQACPIIVHCNNGVGRTGTYILIDMVLNKMIKGAKEIDIAATLEHLRDQRPDMVKTKAQFEFALTAVAEEVTAILTSLPS